VGDVRLKLLPHLPSVTWLCLKVLWRILRGNCSRCRACCWVPDLYFSTAPGSTTASKPMPVPSSPLPANPRFPRGVTTRSTFHGAFSRDRRYASSTYNGPGVVPSHTQDTSSMTQQGRMSFLNKLTSKFSRR